MAQVSSISSLFALRYSIFDFNPILQNKFPEGSPLYKELKSLDCAELLKYIDYFRKYVKSCRAFQKQYLAEGKLLEAELMEAEEEHGQEDLDKYMSEYENKRCGPLPPDDTSGTSIQEPQITDFDLAPTQQPPVKELPGETVIKPKPDIPSKPSFPKRSFQPKTDAPNSSPDADWWRSQIRAFQQPEVNSKPATDAAPLTSLPRLRFNPAADGTHDSTDGMHDSLVHHKIDIRLHNNCVIPPRFEPSNFVKHSAVVIGGLIMAPLLVIPAVAAAPAAVGGGGAAVVTLTLKELGKKALIEGGKKAAVVGGKIAASIGIGALLSYLFSPSSKASAKSLPVPDAEPSFTLSAPQQDGKPGPEIEFTKTGASINLPTSSGLMNPSGPASIFIGSNGQPYAFSFVPQEDVNNSLYKSEGPSIGEEAAKAGNKIIAQINNQRIKNHIPPLAQLTAKTPLTRVPIAVPSQH
jgi:hypothetical protein